MGSRTGAFPENYLQDTAVFRSRLSWGAVAALLVFLLACPLFLSNQMLTILTSDPRDQRTFRHGRSVLPHRLA